jgi:Ca-activated chloride channel homolog
MGPLTAARIAQSLGVKIYTVGMGSDGVVNSPTYQNDDGSFAFANRQMTFDAQLLQQIADISLGKNYRVRTTADLNGIYEAIESLEKTKVTTVAVKRTTELFFWFLNAAFCLLVLELMLRWGPLRVITV